MRATFRQSMAWLHAWSSLVVGWVLFAIFFTGTLSYYRAEISQWMRPELRAGRPVDVALAAEGAVRALTKQAPDARSWFVTLPSRESPVTRIVWRERPGVPFSVALLDPGTGAPSPARDTRGGDFLYRFHYELHLPPLWGRWIVGGCAMVMLVALLSGIVTHRRIFKDLFTFRPGAAPQRAWLDAHNVTGVLALPFHLMITYTGLVTLMLLYMPWGLDAAYHGNRDRYFQERGQSIAARPPAEAPGVLASLGPMIREAERLTVSEATFVAIHHPRDARSTVVVTMDEPEGLAHLHPAVGFDGTTGAVLGTTTPASVATTINGTMVGLHEAHFASPALRLLFFLSGLMGCAMVATGLVLWTVARLPVAKLGMASGAVRLPLNHRLVHVLNIGMLAGLPIAVACYFLANRLLPPGMPGRLDWEVRTFFAAWLLTGLAALAASSITPCRAWSVALTAVAILAISLPIISGLTTERHFIASLRAGDAAFVSFDVVALCVGGGFALAAYTLARSRLGARWTEQPASQI